MKLKHETAPRELSDSQAFTRQKRTNKHKTTPRHPSQAFTTTTLHYSITKTKYDAHKQAPSEKNLKKQTNKQTKQKGKNTQNSKVNDRPH